jgi:membrane associated rhomboid family serine protease
MAAAATVNLPPETRQAMETSGVTKTLWREMIERRQGARPPLREYEMDDANFEYATAQVDWKLVWLLLGLPLEVKPPPLSSKPWATWSLAALIVVSSVAALFWGPASVVSLGLIPSHLWRYGGLTFVTSFFLHGSLWHLLSNVYFLLVFGDDAEDQLGRGPFLALVALSAIAGDLLYAALNPMSTVPVIGASGGISGAIAFYALRFPRRRLRLVIGFPVARRLIVGRLLDVRASAALVLWAIVQLVGLAVPELTEGTESVAYLAHLGDDPRHPRRHLFAGGLRKGGTRSKRATRDELGQPGRIAPRRWASGRPRSRSHPAGSKREGTTCSWPRSTSIARLRGVVRALLWLFTWSSSLETWCLATQASLGRLRVNKPESVNNVSGH